MHISREVEYCDEQTLPRQSSHNSYFRSFKRWIHGCTPTVLQQLTLTAWHSYGFLYFRSVIDLTASGFGWLYFISQLSKVVTISLIKCYTQTPSTSRKWSWFCLRDQITIHLFGSVGVLFFWPFLLAPCIGCIVKPTIPIMALAYFFPFVFFSCFLTTIGMTGHFIQEALPVQSNHSRYLENVLQSCTHKSTIGLVLHLITWMFLANSKGQGISTDTQSAFGNQTLFIVITGFCTTILYYLTDYDLKHSQKTRPRKRPPEQQAEANAPTPAQATPLTKTKEVYRLHFASPWKLRCQELNYLLSVFVYVLSTNTFNIVLLLLPVYLIETVKANKLSVANFPAVVFGGFSIGTLTVKKLIMTYGYRALFCASSGVTLTAGIWFLSQSINLSDLLYFPALTFGFSSCVMIVTSHMMLFISSKTSSLHLTDADDFVKAMDELWNGFVVFVIMQAFPDGHQRSHASKQSGDFLRIALFYVPAVHVAVAVIEVLFYLTQQDEISDNMQRIQEHVKRLELLRRPIVDNNDIAVAIAQADLEKLKDLPASDV